MDKKILNNEIVLCRPAVRKARVIVIRKILKKMKILKSCKIEAEKEKKLKKSDRLFEKVQIMKKLKDDDVTKFALRNKDLEMYLKESKFSTKQIALTLLAKHEAVMKKVNEIREKIPNWESELPYLLDSLGKKKKRKKKTLSIKFENAKALNKIGKSDQKSIRAKFESKTEKTVDSSREISDDSSSWISNNLQKDDELEKEEREVRQNMIKDSNGNSNISNLSCVEIEKIDDPFFIAKKVVAPKLLLERRKTCEETEKREKTKLEKDYKTSGFNKIPFKLKRDPKKFQVQKQFPESGEEKLHPSWAAKKIKLFKPFEGKKITFSDD